MATLNNIGTPVTNFYPTAGGRSQSPPTAQPITASASGSVSQSASGSVSFAANPGVWTVALLALTFLILHKGGIVNE